MWFPLVYVGVAAPMLMFGFPRNSQSLLPMVLAIVLTTGFLTLSELRALNEKIELGPDGIVWTDFLGREKLKAPIDSVQKVELRTNQSSRNSIDFCKVTTTAGTISFNQYLNGYKELVVKLQEIERANESRTRATVA
jgi:hypothetical protein